MSDAALNRKWKGKVVVLRQGFRNNGGERFNVGEKFIVTKVQGGKFNLKRPAAWITGIDADAVYESDAQDWFYARRELNAQLED